MTSDADPTAPQGINSSTSVPHNTALQHQCRALFRDCALVEIIHLHDCLRGAVRALEADVQQLETPEQYRRAASRFQVIWSVFRAHSAAEDEFIWPALAKKTNISGRDSGEASSCSTGSTAVNPSAAAASNTTDNKVSAQKDSATAEAVPSSVVNDEEYAEDHADEERMFEEMDQLWKRLRDGLLRRDRPETQTTAAALRQHTNRLSQHLATHLLKEETQCMPLVVQHLTKQEIHELVGQIMGKRSADTIAQIMTLGVQTLRPEDRNEMIRYMKQAMSGTFFDRWLDMSGWMKSNPKEGEESDKEADDTNIEGQDRKRPAQVSETDSTDRITARARINVDPMAPATPVAVSDPLQFMKQCIPTDEASKITSQQELEKSIRAIATNPALSSHEKNQFIQGLRDSVLKSNQRKQMVNATESMNAPTLVNTQSRTLQFPHETRSLAAPAVQASERRVTPPSMYFSRNKSNKVELVWSSEEVGETLGDSSCVASGRVSHTSSSISPTVPTFSASELAPTYHDGATGSILGCPHYARTCKLRHPVSGRLYTCRLCCQQDRERGVVARSLSSRSNEEEVQLDRYAVTEVLCMICHALQPATDRCLNADCSGRGKPFAKYYCRICHLYDDDGSKHIFHCPYCNCCRLGKGLGIDFRHCMRCNACVSLKDDSHQCIPQKLQGTCPICKDTLFSSTEALRGLKCGHVLHLSCFTQYRRGHSYTCPLCMRSMEDMKDYFSMLDTAIRMQPMPVAHLHTMSNIYCQDCCETGQVQYHFVGLKCRSCGSYNTRELGRVDASST